MLSDLPWIWNAFQSHSENKANEQNDVEQKKSRGFESMHNIHLIQNVFEIRLVAVAKRSSNLKAAPVLRVFQF